MKKLHLLCNAHLDPVWLWAREEGIAEAISTFRVAADFCERFDGFVFNHNEAVLYEWVEEYAPALFEHIQKLVRDGKWHIMGGWYLQPDCLMPSGEGFLRQIEIGNRYFMEKFGVKPTTAINVDSFGHTRGLVQIMKKSGYDSYIFMRPNGIIPQHDFIWKGFDGSEIVAHCIRGGYATNKGTAEPRLNDVIANGHTDPELMLWGIGNHGGGPSKADLESINAIIDAHDDIEIVHSTPEAYIAEVDRDTLQTEERSMNHIFVGCYTSMSRIKRAYRALENELITTEKMLAVADVEADLTDAEKAMLFCQFHDVLPGTMIKRGEDECLRLLQYGREILDRMRTKAFYKLTVGQPVAKDGEIPVMVFNPHPYSVTQDVEIEFQLQDQNWHDNEFTLAKVRDKNGQYLPTQSEKESSSVNLDWRKRVVFRATLEPMSINRFDCELYIENANKRPVPPLEQTDTHFAFDNGAMRVLINKESGLIDRYAVNGVEYLKQNGAKITVFEDNEDPWQMGFHGYQTSLGDFTALSSAEANAFRGYPNEQYDNLLVIENGPVRCKLQAIFKHRHSYAIVTYTLPKSGTYIDLHIKTLINDTNLMYKLCLDTTLTDSHFVGQTAYGREELRHDGNEAPFQKWCALHNDTHTLAVLNRGHYGGSSFDNVLTVSMMRTAVYSAHPILERQLTDHDRNHDHIDMGEHEFDFRLTVDGQYLDADAEAYNQPVYAISYFPDGNGEKRNATVTLDNRRIVLSSYRKHKNAHLLRLFNTSEQPQTAVLSMENNTFSLLFAPFEAKALLLEGNDLHETVLSFVE